MAITPQFVNEPNTACTKIENADGTTVKTVFTPGSDGSRIEGIFATTDNTADIAVTLYLEQGGVLFPIDRVTLPSGIVTRPIQYVNLLNPVRLNFLGQSFIGSDSPGLVISSGTLVRAKTETTVASSRSVNIFVIGGNF